MQPTHTVGERLYNYFHSINAIDDEDIKDWDSFFDLKLVPEVLEETIRFYGPQDNNLEARFPGLDYMSAWHRLRLSQFP